MTIDSIAALIGPLVGAGAGTYFGLKGALNGLKETAKRIDLSLTEVRDIVRDTARDVEQHRQDSARYVRELKQEIQHPD